MKTFSPYISIILDEEDFEAEQICLINKFAEDKDWSFRQLLHTIFSDLTKSYHDMKRLTLYIFVACITTLLSGCKENYSNGEKVETL